jgi:hypothetical protein
MPVKTLVGPLAPGNPADVRFTALPELDANGWRVVKPAPLFPKDAPPA